MVINGHIVGACKTLWFIWSAIDFNRTQTTSKALRYAMYVTGNRPIAIFVPVIYDGRKLKSIKSSDLLLQRVGHVVPNLFAETFMSRIISTDSTQS